MSQILTPAYTFANIGNALNELANLYKTYNDPNATNLEKANAVMNAAGATLTMISIILESKGAALPADILAVTPATGSLGTAQAILINSISVYQNNSNTDSLNSIIQATGDLIAAGGGELTTMGVLAGNPLATEWGIGIQTYGNAITAANKNYDLLPTAITDPIFSVFDNLQNFGSWLGGFTYDTIQAISGSTPANVYIPPVINNTNGSVTTQYSDGSASTKVINPDNSYTVSTAQTDGSTSVINFNQDSSVSSVSTRTVNGDGTYTLANTDANGSVTSTIYNASDDSVVSKSVINADGSSSDTSYFNNGYVSSTITNADGSGSTTIFNFDTGKIGTKFVAFSSVTSSDGSVSNSYYYDGIKYEEDIVNSDGSGSATYYYLDYGPNIINSKRINNADGSWSETDYFPDGLTNAVSITNVDGSHTATTTYYDSTGGVASEDIIRADGSSTQIDGMTVYNYPPNGNIGPENVSMTYADGSSESWTYFVGSLNTILSSHTITNADGSSSHDTFYANGVIASTSTTYADGSSGVVTRAANGYETSEVRKFADGSSTSTTYYPQDVLKSTTYSNADGSSGSTNYYFNGNVSSYETNFADGSVISANYDVSGATQSDSWHKADGSFGTDNADGSGSGKTYLADGSYYTYTYDPLGHFTTNNYDANGNLLAQGYSTAVDDGMGNVTTTYFDAGGNKLRDIWKQASGTTGSDVFNVGGVSGVTESKVDYTYADGSTYSTDTVNDPNGSYQQSIAKSDGSTSTSGYNAATGEVTGSVATAGAGYSYTYGNTQNVGGVRGETESKVAYTYADGSTYSTDTVNDPNGSYQQSTAKSDGSTTTTDYNAATGEVTGSVATAGAGYSYTYDNTQNVGGVSGETESKVAYTYADGSTYSTDTVSDPNGSYQQSTAKSDGSTTTTDYNAATGEVTGSVATTGAGYSYAYDNTQNVGGVSGENESQVTYTYADGSTYSTDTVNDPNGSYQQSTAKSDGSTTTTDYNSATGEVIGSNATAGAGYSYAYDNTQNVGGVSGVTESKVAYTYADGSTYSTDTVNDPNGSYQQSTAKSDGSTTTTDYNAATGEVTGSVATAGAGYSYTYDNTQNVNGVAGETESKVAYTYADGSTYSTDTVNDPNGSYQQSTAKSDGSTTTTDYNAATGEVTGSVATAGAGYSYTYDNTQNVGGVSGETESKVAYTYADGSTYSTDTVNDPNGSYQQSTTKSDGSTTTTDYNAATGEVTGSVATAGAGYSYTYDSTQNVGGVSGETESKVAYTYADGSTYATDTVSDPNGSYQQSTAKSDGSSGSTDYNAATGEVIGSNATAGAGYSYTYDNTQNVGGVSGVNESKVDYTYADGSTYNTDTVSDPNGSYQQSTAKSDGSSGSTDYNAATGEVIGSNATAGAGYSYSYDNTQNVDGVSGKTESKVAYTYADGSTYSTDTVNNPDSSYFQSWSKSDGTAGSVAVNANGTVAGDSWLHADSSQGVDAGSNHLLMGGAGTDVLAAATGNDLIIGGQGIDTLTTGSGTDIIAFNKGDGQDVVNAVSGQNNTLSLGGNFAYSDLALQKNGNDLVLDVSNPSTSSGQAQDSITFKNWYAGAQNIVDLQVIASSMSDFNPSSTDVLRNSNVENFDFQSLVTAFDQAQAANPTLTAWGLTDSLLSAHLASSDIAALGGDLAYAYGTSGNLTGFGVSAAESTLSSSQFAAAPQTLNPWPTLNTGTAQIK